MSHNHSIKNRGRRFVSSIVIGMCSVNFGPNQTNKNNQYLKKSMQKHNNDAIRHHTTGKGGSSFATHFGTIFINWRKGTVSQRLIRNSIDYSILWKGNPLSTVKTFGTAHCKLCAQERLEIMKRARYRSNTLINKKRDLYEACNHKPQFHRYKPTEMTSTDETHRSRKGTNTESYHRVTASV